VVLAVCAAAAVFYAVLEDRVRPASVFLNSAELHSGGAADALPKRLIPHVAAVLNREQK